MTDILLAVIAVLLAASLFLAVVRSPALYNRLTRIENRLTIAERRMSTHERVVHPDIR